MLQKLTLTIIAATLLTACAQPMGGSDSQSSYRQQGLITTSTSEGACDDVGQFIHIRPAAGGLSVGPGDFTLEADAAPKP
ncbi:MAG TPA: hypothetical protein VGN88_04975 [Phycisphaerae bacterium]